MKIESRLLPALGRISKHVEIAELIVRTVPRYNINPECDGEPASRYDDQNQHVMYEDRLQGRIVNKTRYRLAGIAYDIAYFDSAGNFLGLNKSRLLDDSELDIEDYLAIDMKVELPEATHRCVFNVRAKVPGAVSRMFWGS